MSYFPGEVKAAAAVRSLIDPQPASPAISIAATAMRGPHRAQPISSMAPVRRWMAPIFDCPRSFQPLA